MIVTSSPGAMKSLASGSNMAVRPGSTVSWSATASGRLRLARRHDRDADGAGGDGAAAVDDGVLELVGAEARG